MTLDMRKRWLIAGTIIAGIAGASWKYGGEPATAALVERPASQPRGRTFVDMIPHLELEKLELARSDEPIANAFEPRSWVPPASKIKLPPPPPTAPPLPFTYIGKMMEDGRIVVFLTQGERSFTVRSGDKLDNTYQVDDIKPTMMLLTYLPLNQQQSLAIGGAN